MTPPRTGPVRSTSLRTSEAVPSAPGGRGRTGRLGSLRSSSRGPLGARRVMGLAGGRSIPLQRGVGLPCSICKGRRTRRSRAFLASGRCGGRRASRRIGPTGSLMDSRTDSLMGSLVGSRAASSTFHSLAPRILRSTPCSTARSAGGPIPRVPRLLRGSAEIRPGPEALPRTGQPTAGTIRHHGRTGGAAGGAALGRRPCATGSISQQAFIRPPLASRRAGPRAGPGLRGTVCPERAPRGLRSTPP